MLKTQYYTSVLHENKITQEVTVIMTDTYFAIFVAYQHPIHTLLPNQSRICLSDVYTYVAYAILRFAKGAA